MKSVFVVGDEFYVSRGRGDPDQGSSVRSTASWGQERLLQYSHWSWRRRKSRGTSGSDMSIFLLSLMDCISSKQESWRNRKSCAANSFEVLEQCQSIPKAGFKIKSNQIHLVLNRILTSLISVHKIGWIRRETINRFVILNITSCCLVYSEGENKWNGKVC